MKTFFATACIAAVVLGQPADEVVTSLPGMGTGDFPFGVYSGYIELSGTSKMVHYLFVESQGTPSTDPVLIWTNGGPGCSSMLGFTQENGPYSISSGAASPTDYHENPYSWNRQANVLYIEQPAGVGYSYCSGTRDCTFTDHSNGKDNLAVILAWYEKFPNFKPNDLYLSGESYGGIYVPYMAYNIDQHNEDNKDDDSVFKPNLKGFAVGNGVTNWTYDTTPAYVDMGYWHSLYDSGLKVQMDAANCDFSGPYGTKTSEECKTYLSEFNSYVENVNVYDIFGTCWGRGGTPQSNEWDEMIDPKFQPKKKHYTSADYTPWVTRNRESNELPPCTWGSPLVSYLNSNEVRTNLHIPETVGAWDLCTSDINYIIEPQGSQWIYEELATKGKYKMLHYSGDTDGAVATIGTQNWIASMNWNVTKSWAPYQYYNQTTQVNETAGYYEVYHPADVSANLTNLTFGTVHGAGHMAPQFKPPQTYKLVFNWMFNLPL